VNRRLLLGSERVKLAAEVFEPAADVIRLSPRGTLEKTVLDKVRHAVFAR
jgi:hypothetical protein